MYHLKPSLIGQPARQGLHSRIKGDIGILIAYNQTHCTVLLPNGKKDVFRINLLEFV